MSISITRFTRWAQIIARSGMYAVFAGTKTGYGSVALGWRPFIQVGCCQLFLAALALPC
jgi:hypothetical protein